MKELLMQSRLSKREFKGLKLLKIDKIKFARCLMKCRNYNLENCLHRICEKNKNVDIAFKLWELPAGPFYTFKAFHYIAFQKGASF